MVTCQHCCIDINRHFQQTVDCGTASVVVRFLSSLWRILFERIFGSSLGNSVLFFSKISLPIRSSYLFSCISGVGPAQKVADHFASHFASQIASASCV